MLTIVKYQKITGKNGMKISPLYKELFEKKYFFYVNRSNKYNRPIKCIKIIYIGTPKTYWPFDPNTIYGENHV